MSDYLELLPAVDIADGQAVQLVQGVAGSEKKFGGHIQVEMSGGIRDDESLAAAMATGCGRVNIGTAALEQPEWCAAAIAEYGDRVAVGLDVRGRTLAARGWTRVGGDLYDVLARLVGEGVEGAIVGTALYEGRFTLQDALSLTLPGESS